MNERIQELAEQASEKINYRVDPNTFGEIDDPNGPHIRTQFNKEKFAELIVKECMQVSMKAVGMDAEYEAWYLIKQHFGIEE